MTWVCAVAVIPAKAGTQNSVDGLGPGLRRGDVSGHVNPDHSLNSVTHWSLERTEEEPEAAASTQMVILDPDRHAPLSSWPAGTLKLASLSVGEAEDRRPYWAGISSASYLVEQDKEQEGATRVDFRDPDWRTLLLKEEIPRALAGGFQGFLLESLDSIHDLEEKDPAAFTGSLDALQGWLADLRKAYPDLILLAGGSESLETAAPYVDGYVVDGVFTTWDTALHRARRTTEEERDERLDQIGNALVRAPHPVFTIEYADPNDPALAAFAVEQSRKRRFRPFVKIR